jgi:periplasmic protein TonB
MASDTNEKKRRTTAMAISVVFHAGILLLFFFIMAWRAPDPPLPEYGIELNFGTDNVGSGNVQSTSPANNAPKVADAKPNPPAPQPEPVKAEPLPEPEVKATPAPTPAPTVQEVPVTQPEPSPAVVEKKEPVKKPEPKPVVEEKPKEEPKPKVEEKPKEPAPKPVNQNALMTPTKPGSGGKEGTSDKPAGNNNGDDTGKVGDKGNPEGKLDARALYGTPGAGNGGGGNGASISVTGWTWDKKPNVKDNSNESGKIIFQIKVDDMGQIISVTTKESTVSPAIAALYKKALEGLYLQQTSSNDPAPISVGTVVFVIEAK